MDTHIYTLTAHTHACSCVCVCDRVQTYIHTTTHVLHIPMWRVGCRVVRFVGVGMVPAGWGSGDAWSVVVGWIWVVKG